MQNSLFESPSASTHGPFSPETNGRANKLDASDRKIHDWYRFVLSFPPHLVRSYLDAFDVSPTSIVLDPFCGTGTTLVECKLRGVGSIGLEANPFAQFASAVKVDWSIDPEVLRRASAQVANDARAILLAQGIDDNKLLRRVPNRLPLRQLSSDQMRLLLADSISPIPLHKTLVLLDCLQQRKDETTYRHQLLALANALVFAISNLHFGPEVGIGKPKQDIPVIARWMHEIQKIASDLEQVSDRPPCNAQVHLGDARRIDDMLPANSVDAVITSPPYPNEKDYTRTTRLESIILGFISSKGELRDLKQSLVRSNTRNVYKDDDDDKWVADNATIRRIAERIEQRRVDLGKTSGFERLYGRVTQLYFGGMVRHLSGLRKVLRPGALLAYVVGDQASYLRVMIRTGQIIAELAQSLGYEIVRVDLFRTRFASATQEQLREEVVILRWPGGKHNAPRPE